MEQRSLTEDLIAQLAHMDAPAQGAYRVDEVLKRSGTEVTEVVYYPGRDGGELGPFVRKRILAASGAGSAYDAIIQAERAGERFLFLPRVMDIRRVDDEVHVVMEFVPGETLDTLVDCVGASPELACRLMPRRPRSCMSVFSRPSSTATSRRRISWCWIPTAPQNPLSP